jgi:hypothetical protein
VWSSLNRLRSVRACVCPCVCLQVFQTLIDLPVEEREGGYGDRSGKKNERYIEFLEKDLAEYPNDTRTLYYLGYAHFDIYNQHKDNPSAEHWDHLAKGVQYFKTRANTTGGNDEELWFALLKVSRSCDIECGGRPDRPAACRLTAT